MKKWIGIILIFLMPIIAYACGENKVDDKSEKDVEETSCFVPDERTKILKVGKNKEFSTISAAALAATDSCIVEIDAGTYAGDVARWTQDNLIIRSVGGEVVLDADGKSFGSMGIWVVDGGTICIEGITFKNAKVPDLNGAGIRLAKGFVTVKNCRFLNNENGILTSNDGVSTLTIQNSEFGYGGAGDGYSHNIYDIV